MKRTMQQNVPPSFERESSLLSGAMLLVALIGLLVVVVQVGREYQTRPDPDVSVPLALRSPGH